MGDRYAIFSARYAPLTGGVEQYTQYLAHALVAQGDDVVVVTSSLDPVSASYEVQKDGVEVQRLPCWSLMDGRLPVSRRSAAYRNQMSKLEHDGITRVLVNTRFYRHSLEGVRLARCLGVPAMVLDHGSAYLVLGNRVADAMLCAYEHGITALGKRYQPQYAGVSALSVKWLETFGIRTKYVLPNAIDAHEFRACASKRDFRSELKIHPEQHLVVFTGRLTPEKGALELAQALGSLGEDYVAVLAGEGPLRRQIVELNLPNVHLAGLIGREDLSALLSEGDVFCLPTRSEGFCTALLEAGAWGLTPIMPRVGGVDEVMGNPVCFGALLEGLSPATIARSIRETVNRGAAGHSQALREVVEKDFAWGETARAVRRAFEDAGRTRALER